MLKTPKSLFQGARVALVGGSGPLPSPDRLDPAFAALRSVLNRCCFRAQPSAMVILQAATRDAQVT